MKKMNGIGVSDGIALGRALLLRGGDGADRTAAPADRACRNGEKRESGGMVAVTGEPAGTSPISPEAEERRLLEAVDRAKERLDRLYAQSRAEVGEKGQTASGTPDISEIFAVHRMMLEQEDFLSGALGHIRSGSTAEDAVRRTGEELCELLRATGDDYLKNRATDVRDATDGVLAILSGRTGGVGFPDSVDRAIVCADDLTPGQTAELDRNRVIALVTAGGSANSHTAILARSRGIPAVVEAGTDFLDELAAHPDGVELAVDGQTGELIFEPDEVLRAEIERRIALQSDEQAELEALAEGECRTGSGRRILLYANVGSPEDCDRSVRERAEGIGLMRSEFLYLGRPDLPSEDEQLAAYRTLLERMDHRRVVIRTLDLGADKQAGSLGLPKEENPALGYRAIRICLDRPEIFRPQLRALYRASAYGRLAILFPMIASVWEVEEVLSVCRSVREELAAEGIAFSDSVEHGIMIETPASALLADRLAPLVDFFSVGTNDLTQYTLACDRQNGRLGRFCDPHHEAIFRLIANAADCAHRCGKWIGICGELAADVQVTGRLLELGIDELSVAPAALLRVKKAIGECR